MNGQREHGPIQFAMFDKRNGGYSDTRLDWKVILFCPLPDVPDGMLKECGVRM